VSQSPCPQLKASVRMRKPIASLALLALIALWVGLVGTLSDMIGGWPRWAQPVFYIVAGLGWIIPLKPLFKWMNSGPQEELDD
jgi:uncharacterized membrane protein YuzA (DUF378 family)